MFTGILPVLKTKAGIACIMGHEIAHVLQRHSAESLSITAGVFAIAAAIIFMFGVSDLYFTNLLLQMIISLPFSRKQYGAALRPLAPLPAPTVIRGRLRAAGASESEADYVGLLLMAAACFEPAEAVAVWKVRRADPLTHGTPSPWRRRAVRQVRSPLSASRRGRLTQRRRVYRRE